MIFALGLGGADEDWVRFRSSKNLIGFSRNGSNHEMRSITWKKNNGDRSHFINSSSVSTPGRVVVVPA